MATIALVMWGLLLPPIAVWLVFEFNYLDITKRKDVYIGFWLLLGALSVNMLLVAAGVGAGSWKSYYNEVWSYKIVSIRHELEWTTHETRQVKVHDGYETTTHRRSDGSTYTTQREKYHYRTEHYTQHHGPYWTQEDEYGKDKSIAPGDYEHWKQVWGTEKQTGMHKGSSAGGTPIDGPIYTAKWPSTFDTMYPCSDIHTYKNKVRASSASVLKLAKPTPELLAKYPRPADQRNTSQLINYGAPVSITSVDELFMQRINAELGPTKLVHPMFVLFPAEVGMGIVTDVLTAWQGPNKNELVTFIGIDKQGVMSWVKTESWMDNTTLHGLMEEDLLGQKYSSKVLGDACMHLIPKYWLKKDFREFEYLRVDVPVGCAVFAAFLQLALGIGLVWFGNRGGYRA